MPRTITLDRIHITSLTFDWINERVLVSYVLLDTDSRARESGEAVFWKQFPERAPIQKFDEDGDPYPYLSQPDPEPNWYKLPATRGIQLGGIRQDIERALGVLVA
jgi:hypothetical protein